MSGITWLMQKKDAYGKQRKKRLKVENGKMEKHIIYLKKELHTIKKENNSTIEKKNYLYGNKVSMFDTVNQVDEETVPKENNIFLTRELTASLLSGNVEYLDAIDTSLMIEADVTKNKKISEILNMIICFC